MYPACILQNTVFCTYPVYSGTSERRSAQLLFWLMLSESAPEMFLAEAANASPIAVPIGAQIELSIPVVVFRMTGSIVSAAAAAFRARCCSLRSKLRCCFAVLPLSRRCCCCCCCLLLPMLCICTISSPSCPRAARAMRDDGFTIHDDQHVLARVPAAHMHAVASS